jgi:lipopolysaccharide heptosyltransferase II
MIRIKLLKEFDVHIGKIAISLFKPSCFFLKEKPNKILLIRPGGIGDTVLLAPVVTELNKRFPGVVIDVLAEKRNSAVFSLTPALRKIFHYDKPAELLSTILRSYDLVIDTEQWHRLSAVVARLTGAPFLTGYATNERKKLFTHSVPYSHDDYEVDSFFHLLKPLLGDVEWDRSVPFLAISQELKDKAASLLLPLARQKIIAFFPGSSIKERKWGNDRFHECAMLLSKRNYAIVVVGGKDDVKAGAEIVHGLANSLNLSGTLSLPETAAVLNESSVLITGDSGIMHIGYGLGKKIVALFGPGRAKKWAPRGPNCVVINKHLTCSPCTTFGYTPRCRINAECMKKITVEEVFAASMTLLQE